MAEVMEWIKSLSNDELVQHLMNEYGYKCGPITVSTRSVYEKKLQSFKNHTTISGKTIPVSQQETRTDQIRTDQIRTNGSNHNHEEGEEEEDAGKRSIVMMCHLMRYLFSYKTLSVCRSISEWIKSTERKEESSTSFFAINKIKIRGSDERCQDTFFSTHATTVKESDRFELRRGRRVKEPEEIKSSCDDSSYTESSLR